MTDATYIPAADAAEEAGLRDYWRLLKPRVMSLVIFTDRKSVV